MDLFASRLNFQLPRYVSWNPDPEAVATDAFSINWSNDLHYAFPPFSLIGRVLQKIVQDAADVILIVSCWEAQNWWATVNRLAVTKPLILPRDPRLIRLPFNAGAMHPLADKLRLKAVWVSGKS